MAADIGSTDPVPEHYDARLGPHSDTLDPLSRRGAKKWKRRYELEATDHEVTAAERDEAIRDLQKLREVEKVLKGLVKELQAEREDLLFELRTTQELHETVAAETIQAELVPLPCTVSAFSCLIFVTVIR